MNRFSPLAGALALTLAAAPGAMAQDHGRGHGNDDKGGRPERQAREDRPQANQGPERGGRGDDRPQPRADAPRAEPRGRQAVDRPDPPSDRRNDRADLRSGESRDNRPDRGPAVVLPTPERGEPVRFRLAPDRGLIAGCPPGLARKNNGCLPPGQARRIEAERRARYDYVWDRMARDGYRYRYDDGYLYRVNNSGGLLGWLPVLGGALSTGSVWPTQYSYQPVPTYFTDYYRLPDRYDYRYADGVLYGVDRQNSGITQVAALLTGQQWNVGQAMPAGYDVYNVPYAYRDRYADTPERLYRYNDGYVYQVDPTTQLVQAVIQLLT